MHSKLISGTWLFNHCDVINNIAVLAMYLFVFSTDCDQHPVVNNDDIIIPGRSHPLGAASTTKINRTTIRIYSRLFLNHFFCCGCSLLSIYIRPFLICFSVHNNFMINLVRSLTVYNLALRDEMRVLSVILSSNIKFVQWTSTF